MNLINCTEDCIHQKDGCCNLENSMFISSIEKGCSFYEHKKNPAKNDRKSKAVPPII